MVYSFPSSKRHEPTLGVSSNARLGNRLVSVETQTRSHGFFLKETGNG
jgi:hypothetical protein